MKLRSLPRLAAVPLSVLACLFAGAASAPLSAQQPAPSQTLLPGEGAALTMAKCALCHDITHVTRTRLSRDEWDDNIRVMIARGMPIEPHETRIVVDYLATYYNRDKPPPAAAASADAGPAKAASVESLLSSHGCMACHALEKRVVGPSFQEVAQKYKGDSGAMARLAAKVREGGAGAWGPIPMPPHPNLADDDVTRVVGWVLGQ